jgi:hypothetical protein
MLSTTLGAKACSCLTHLIKQVIASLLSSTRLYIIIVVEDLLVLSSLLGVLQVLNDLLVLLATLHLL